MLREGTFAFISVRLTQMGPDVPVCVRIKKGFIREMGRWDCMKKDMALHLLEKFER